MSDIDAQEMLGEIDLTDVDTNMPVLEPQIVRCTVTNMEIKEGKKGPVLKIELKTVEPATSEGRDEPVQPGFPLFDNVSLVATEKYDYKPRLAQIQEAILGEKRRGFAPLEQYIGQEVDVRTKPEGAEDSEYGRQTRISRYVKAE